MTPSFRTLFRCLVCGFSEVRTDEVVDRGVVLLAECPRCQHRWTEPRPAAAEGLAPPAVPVLTRPAREVASAA